MKIWDCFLYAGEADMLECRLRQLEDSAVWRHVIVEAGTDHRGNRKPLWYREQAGRFAAWADRITYVAATAPGLSPFQRIAAQREQTGIALAAAGPDDVILVADVDEIPNAAGIAAVKTATGAGTVLEMTGCFFAADWVWPVPVRTSVAVPYRALRGFTRARERADQTTVAPAAGHHLTWLGGPDAVRVKLRSHCHTEVHAGLDPDRAYRFGGTPFPAWSRVPLIPVDVDERWPVWVVTRACPAAWFRPR